MPTQRKCLKIQILKRKKEISSKSEPILRANPHRTPRHRPPAGDGLGAPQLHGGSVRAGRDAGTGDAQRCPAGKATGADHPAPEPGPSRSIHSSGAGGADPGPQRHDLGRDRKSRGKGIIES